MQFDYLISHVRTDVVPVLKGVSTYMKGLLAGPAEVALQRIAQNPALDPGVGQPEIVDDVAQPPESIDLCGTTLGAMSWRRLLHADGLIYRYCSLGLGRLPVQPFQAFA